MTQVNGSNRLLRCTIFGLLLGLLMTCGTGQVSGQELTAKEQKNVEQVKALITKAGVEFKNEDYRASAKLITNVQNKLIRLSKGEDGMYLQQLQAQHDRMAKAHEMLVSKGQKLKDIAPLNEKKEDKPANSTSGSDGVSFVKTVAPILNAKCGRCHVARNRGNFSAKDYNTLMNSTTVAQGEPDTSYLIEVIVDGSMPKGGLTVSETELASLKKWIAEGAKFDGNNQNQSIAQMNGAGQGDNQNRGEQMTAIKKPTGKETVSFAADVAPVLIENCGRCHMSRDPRANFNMATFRTFLRGGDSGAPVQAGNSGGSLIIKRLRGQEGDIMPPTGSLDAEKINLVAKWIDEGAKFLPADAGLTMQAIAAKGKASRLDHQQLISFRKKEANRIWKLAMSDAEFDTKESDMFLLVGTPTEDGLDGFAEEAKSLAGKISEHLGTESRDHFIRGNGTLFIVTRRYDFGEFGKMLLRREFPRSLKGYWSHNGTIAYSTILKTRDQSVEDMRVVLTRQLASMHVADLAPGIPRWFSDGMGFRVAADLHRKDSVVQGWEREAVAAASSMTKVNDFLMNRMDEHKSGLVSFLFVGQLKKEKGRFNKLMIGLKEGQDFDSVFASVYGGTPEKLFGDYKGRW